jgi:hypothetical protein
LPCLAAAPSPRACKNVRMSSPSLLFSF